MGAVNYYTSDYITLGIKPYDFEDIKQGMLDDDYYSDEEEITDDMVYDMIHDYYDDDWANAESILNKYSFDWFDVELKSGYYEGFTLDISSKFDFYDEEDRQDALKETDELKKCLVDLAGNGMVSCGPGWCTSYCDYNETLKEIDEAIAEIKEEIEKEELYEAKSVVKDILEGKGVKEAINGKKPLMFRASWITSSGDTVKNQLFTADHVSKLLSDLEEWGSTNIKIESIDDAKDIHN